MSFTEALADGVRARTRRLSRAVRAGRRRPERMRGAMRSLARPDAAARLADVADVQAQAQAAQRAEHGGLGLLAFWGSD